MLYNSANYPLKIKPLCRSSNQVRTESSRDQVHSFQDDVRNVLVLCLIEKTKRPLVVTGKTKYLDEDDKDKEGSKEDKRSTRKKSR